MATVQLRRVEQITEQESLQRVKELLDTTVGSIAYLLIFDCLIHSTLTPPPYQKLKRGLFDEENFERELVDSVAVTKIHRNRSKNADQLLDWLEGVHDAIEKKYLKSLIFGIFEDPNEPEKLIESYTFNFDYPSGKSVNVSMDGGSKFPSHISSKQELARASQRVVRSLLLMISTLGTLPADVYITMKLYYYDDVTPQNYEPPGFAPTTTPEFYFPSKPVHLDIGDVKSIHHSVTLKMQTVKDNLEVDDENLKCIEEDLEFRRREDEALLANANGLNGIGNHQNAGNGPGTPTRYKVFGEEEGESTQEIIQKLFQGSTASKPPALRSNFETPTRILTNLESPSPYSITTAVTEQYNPSKDVSPAKTVIVNDMEIDQDLMDVKMEKYEEKSENELEDEFEIVNCGCSFNEADGQMIQCSKCNSWSHIYCNGFLSEASPLIPDQFVCAICKYPPLPIHLFLTRRTIGILQSEKIHNVEQLSDRLGVSVVLAREVFQTLKGDGLLIRSGGLSVSKKSKERVAFWMSEKCFNLDAVRSKQDLKLTDSNGKIKPEKPKIKIEEQQPIVKMQDLSSDGFDTPMETNFPEVAIGRTRESTVVVGSSPVTIKSNDDTQILVPDSQQGRPFLESARSVNSSLAQSAILSSGAIYTSQDSNQASSPDFSRQSQKRSQPIPEYSDPISEVLHSPTPKPNPSAFRQFTTFSSDPIDEYETENSQVCSAADSTKFLKNAEKLVEATRSKVVDNTGFVDFGSDEEMKSSAHDFGVTKSSGHQRAGRGRMNGKSGKKGGRGSRSNRKVSTAGVLSIQMGVDDSYSQIP